MDGRRLVTVDAPKKNSERFFALLTPLRRVHPTAPRIHVILDNCAIHSSVRVRRYLATTPTLILHFLLPYSPDDNRIERL